jgi:hypothetical protein
MMTGKVSLRAWRGGAARERIAELERELADFRRRYDEEVAEFNAGHDAAISGAPESDEPANCPHDQWRVGYAWGARGRLKERVAAIAELEESLAGCDRVRALQLERIAELERERSQLRELSRDKGALLADYRAAMLKREERIGKLVAALREAQIYSECPRCMESAACADECEHEADDAHAYAELQWRREHNAAIEAALAGSGPAREPKRTPLPPPDPDLYNLVMRP